MVKARRGRLLAAALFSPKGYLLWAASFALLFFAFHLLGFREATSVLALAVPEGLTADRARLYAALYLIFYLIFVLLCPVLVLAAGIQTAISRATLWMVRADSDPALVTPSSIRAVVDSGFRTHPRRLSRPVVRSPRARLRGALAVQVGVVSVLHVIVYVLGELGGTERIGVLLGLAAGALALRVWWSTSVWELAVLGLVGAAQAVNFVLVLAAAPIPFSHRLLLVLTTSLYLAVPVILVGMLLPKPKAGAVILLAMSLTAGALTVETLGSWLVSRQAETLALNMADPDYVARDRGAMEQHPEMGPIPVANSVTETLYPDDPRGYFRFRDPSWSLTVRPSSDARLDVATEEIGVVIDRADDPTPWHIQLSHNGLEVVEGTEYLLRFLVRATREREYGFHVSMAHPPWESLGFYQTATAPTEGGGVWRTFTANQSDDSVRVTFDLGGDTADVYVSDLKLARSDGGPRVESRLRAEYYVSYEWNSRGCRAPEYPIPPAPEAFRVLALGDSYTAGKGVHAEDVFTSVMERLLRERASDTRDPRLFQVVGCGVSGFSTREERRYYEERASVYRPDLVLVVMTADDDRSRADDVRLGFVHTPAKWEYLAHTGYLVQHMRHARPKPDFSESMAELAELQDVVREDGAELAVVVFTTGVDPAWDRLSASADSTARALGMPILDLGDALVTGDASSELRVHPIDRHPNEIAHRIAAEAIVEWLEREGLIEPPRAGRQ